MSFKSDVDSCKHYLNLVFKYQNAIDDIYYNKSDTTNTTLSDGMPKGNKISNRTMNEALDNVSVGDKIDKIEKKKQRIQYNIEKVLDKFADSEEIYKSILQEMYINFKNKNQIALDLKITMPKMEHLLNQSYIRYTYYFYRGKKPVKRG